MVLTGLDEVWLTALVRVILPTGNNTMNLPVSPTPQALSVEIHHCSIELYLLTRQQLETLHDTYVNKYTITISYIAIFILSIFK